MIRPISGSGIAEGGTKRGRPSFPLTRAGLGFGNGLPRPTGLLEWVVMVTNDRTVPYELANERGSPFHRTSEPSALRKHGSRSREDDGARTFCGRAGGGACDVAGGAYHVCFVQRLHPFTAHFPSPSSFRTTQRLGTQTFSELEPPLPAPFCGCGERGYCGG